MYRYYYTEDGVIVRRFTLTPGFEFTHEGSYVDDATFRDINLCKYIDGEFVDYTPPTVTRTTPYDQARRNNFGTAEQQMALLYDDIKAGLFGEDAKTGLWYLHVKAVKDANPKD
jgi:hypothetical protein